MNNSTLFWLAITLVCICVQGFYSMLEMAAVSFNRVRLEYYVSKGVKRAQWLQHLLERPSRLFGTIMIGVNVSLQVGSQSSRELYRTLHLDPNIAPITQVLLVVIIAELVPLFAARRHAEHVVMLGIPIIYWTARLLAPLIWALGVLSRLVARLIGSHDRAFNVFITRDELQKVVESHEESRGETDEFNVVVASLFTLQGKVAAQVMTPLNQVAMLPSSATVKQFRQRIGGHPQLALMPIYHKERSNIVGIASPRDLVQAAEGKRVRDSAKPPWFLADQTKLTQILQEFRKNKRTVAVVLGKTGAAVGVLTLDAVLQEIFGSYETPAEPPESPALHLVDRTFPGNTSISSFNQEFGAQLPTEGAETLAQLVVMQLAHPAEKGDSVVVGRFEFTAEETTLLGIKTISVRSLD